MRASVRDLLGEGAQRVIGLSGGGLSRLWIGQELHRRVQASLAAAERGYRSEVPAAATFQLDGWTLELEGRADGLLARDGLVVRVDEIKTLHFAVDLYNLYANERLERFRQQARLYALMLSPAEAPAAVRLILVDIVSGDERIEDVPFSPDASLAFLRQQVHRLLAAEQRRVARLAELRITAAALPFPHPEPRPLQLTVGEAVDSALAAGRHLLLAAPTGTGKTAAVLHPALRAALARGRRLYVLTAKTLQQQLAVETLRSMQRHGARFRSLQLRSKAKMCINSEMVCHEEFCPYARDYALKLVRSGLLPTLLASDHVDPDVVLDAARQHEVCPFEVTLDLLADMDVVVCDYNYVFDPTIGLAALLHEGALRHAILVVDEAHNLVERSREYYSPALTEAMLRRAEAFLAARTAPVFRRLAELVATLAELLHTTVADALEEATQEDAVVELPGADLADLRLALDAAMLQYFLYKREHELWLADDPPMEVFLTLTRFHRVLSLGGDEFVHLASRGGAEGERIRIVCRDASRFIGEILEESAGVVAMSATLEPFEFYHDVLGFDRHRTDTLRVPSPFPPSHRLVLAIDEVDTSYRRRAAHYDDIARWVGGLAPPGHNVLALFPSYAFLRQVHDRLPPTPHHVLVQEPGSSDAVQRRFLAALSNGEAHLVLAVLGGVFAEGVDYPGEMLSQVIVVSPGLPQYNAERELLKAFYQERYGRGFEYAYLIPGLTRVVQAAGRLIRSETDRGVIALVCRRFLQPQMVRLLPPDWVDGDAESLRLADPIAAVRAFFGDDRAGS